MSPSFARCGFARFDELAHKPELNREDGDRLSFSASLLEDLGWKEGQPEPEVTPNTVRKLLAEIRKKKTQKK